MVGRADRRPATPHLAGLEAELGFDALGGATGGWLKIAELVWPGPGAGGLRGLRMDWKLTGKSAAPPRGELGLGLAWLAPPHSAVGKTLELIGLTLKVGPSPQRSPNESIRATTSSF